MSENGAEILHNPVSAASTVTSFLVSRSFIEKTDAEIEQMAADGTAVDPILDAQALPVRFSIPPDETASRSRPA